MILNGLLAPLTRIDVFNSESVTFSLWSTGKGARFRLWLPESPVSREVHHPAEPLDSSALKGLRVLLVDDSLEALEAFRTLLELEGAQVQAEATPKHALAAATSGDVDLILSDIGMPEMDGYELIKALRRLPGMAAVPAHRTYRVRTCTGCDESVARWF